MTVNKYTDGEDIDSARQNQNVNSLSVFIATNKINNKKAHSYTTSGEALDNSQTLNLVSTSDLQAATYNSPGVYANSGYAWIDTTYGIIYAGVLYDSYSDGSVDANKWTGSGDGTNSESANAYIQRLSGYNSGTSVILDATGASGINLKPAVTNSECIFKTYFGADSVGIAMTHGVSLLIRDNLGNEVTLDSAASGSSTTTSHYLDKSYRLVFTSNSVTVYTSANKAGVVVDLSSLAGTTWFLRGYAYAADPRLVLTVKFYQIVYTNNSTISASTIETIRTAVTPTVTTAFVHSYDSGDGLGTSVTAVSANNGSNYTTVVQDTWTPIVNSGTTVSVKYTLQGTTRQKLIKIDSQCLLY